MHVFILFYTLLDNLGSYLRLSFKSCVNIGAAQRTVSPTIASPGISQALGFGTQYQQVKAPSITKIEPFSTMRRSTDYLSNMNSVVKR